MITTSDRVYEFTELAMQKCRVHAFGDIAQQLDDALHLGSSGLEILGAIRAVFVARRTELELVLDKHQVQDVIQYVNTVFGTK